MRKILIWSEYCYGGHTDLWRCIDDSKLFEEIRMYCNGIPTNTGNKVWMQGLISEISTCENEIYFRNPSESWEVINNKYDLIVHSSANLINVEFRKHLVDLTESFSHSKIPVYIISVGAQEKSYDNIHDLCDVIESDLKRLIEVVYASGGEFGLRGYFTKEVFDMVSKNTAEVIGCPSIYQNGSNLFIEKKIVSEREFKPVINGWSKIGSYALMSYEKSIFIDQDEIFRPLYDLDFYKNIDNAKIFERLVRRIGYLNVKLLLQDRIKLFYDIPQWRRFIISGDYSFSYGSRIHGNIMSILSGVPSLIYTKDTRTRELAEFYKIPHYTKEPNTTLYEEFLKVDYTEFNKTYKIKYKKFKEFLLSHNIVDDINENNIFWNKEEPKKNKEVESKLLKIRKFSEKNGDNCHAKISERKYNHKKFIIFGAGNLGAEAIKLVGERNVKCFVDNDKMKQQNGYMGYEVCALDNLFIDKKNDVIIIAASEKYIDSIFTQLDNRGICNYYTIKGIKSELVMCRKEITDFGL